MKTEEEKKLRQEWRTPKILIDTLRKEFGIQRDVACTCENCILGEGAYAFQMITETQDAFTTPWFQHNLIYISTVFCNPPFHDPAPWIDRAIEQVSGGPGRTVIMLLNAGLGTKWFVEAKKKASEGRILNPRPQYDPPPGIPRTSNPRDGIILIFRTPPATGKRPINLWVWEWTKEAK